MPKNEKGSSFWAMGSGPGDPLFDMRTGGGGHNNSTTTEGPSSSAKYTSVQQEDLSVSAKVNEGQGRDIASKRSSPVKSGKLAVDKGRIKPKGSKISLKKKPIKVTQKGPSATKKPVKGLRKPQARMEQEKAAKKGDDVSVAVLGLGFLGTRIAAEISMLGLNVYAYDAFAPVDRSRKQITEAMMDIFKVADPSLKKQETKYFAALATAKSELLKQGVAEVTQSANGMDSRDVALAARERVFAIQVDQLLQRRLKVCTTIKEAVEKVSLVIEAVVEREDVKIKVFKEVERYCSEDCVITTNTLRIPLSALRRPLMRPNSLVGLRFLSPVLGIPFVEVWCDPPQKKAMAAVVELMAQRAKIVFRFEEPEASEASVRRLRLMGPEARTHQVRSISMLLRHMTRAMTASSARNAGPPSRSAAATKIGGDNACDSTVTWVHDVWAKDQAKGDAMQVCVVCLDAIASVMILPCGHQILCEACAGPLKLCSPVCPVCRVHVTSVVNRVTTY